MNGDNDLEIYSEFVKNKIKCKVANDIAKKVIKHFISNTDFNEKTDIISKNIISSLKIEDVIGCASSDIKKIEMK